MSLQIKKIHDLITLKSIISSIYSSDIDEDLLSLLNKLYIDSRYPSGFGLLPNGRPTLDDAKLFYEFAQNIHTDISNFLTIEPDDPN